VLVGVAFSFFFSVAGLMLGWAVDHWSRRHILAICVAVFGAATLAAAQAASYVQLLATRLVVGAGEAGGGPAMVSIIADRFPASRRAFAMSIFYMGVPIGLLLTFLIGGYLAGSYGWRSAFYAAGLPAVALAALAYATVKEPPRILSAAGKITVGAALRHFATQPSAVQILLTVIFHTAAMTAMIGFVSSFLIRSHGFPLQEVGVIMALSLGVGGAIASPLGGMLVDKLAVRDVRWRSWYCAVVQTISTSSAVLALLVAPKAGVVPLLIVWGFFATAGYGPQMAAFQAVIAPPTRGVGTASYYLLGQLVGGAGGALIAGMLSDALAPAFGGDSLRYALAITVCFNFWAALHWLLSARTLKRDIERTAVAFEV
jgi:predicted MFS family arabinose efflux permease